MLKDRIQIRRIVKDEKPTILHDCSVGMCREMCGFYDEGMFHITGDYMLPDNIEVIYTKTEYTRYQRLLIWLLRHSTGK